jgi:hypothetical protein
MPSEDENLELDVMPKERLKNITKIAPMLLQVAATTSNNPSPFTSATAKPQPDTWRGGEGGEVAKRKTSIPCCACHLLTPLSTQPQTPLQPISLMSTLPFPSQKIPCPISQW